MEDLEKLYKEKGILINKLHEVYEMIKINSKLGPQIGVISAQIDKVNKQICNIKGHTFNEWEQFKNLAGLGWYYSRKCSCCGFNEISYTVPKDYNGDMSIKL